MDRLSRIDGGAWFACGLGFVVAGILVEGARHISPPIFDPVGSAALPRVCAVALMGLGLGTVIQSALSRAPIVPRPAALPIRPATAGVFLLMGAYLAAMQADLGFTLSTVLFVTFAIPLVAKSAASLPIALAAGLVLGFGCEWLFTSVFFIDLPDFR